jgi:hypothetical protein
VEATKKAAAVATANKAAATAAAAEEAATAVRAAERLAAMTRQATVGGCQETIKQIDAAAKEAAAAAAAKEAAEMEERWSNEKVSSWFFEVHRMDDHGGLKFCTNQGIMRSHLREDMQRWITGVYGNESGYRCVDVHWWVIS